MLEFNRPAIHGLGEGRECFRNFHRGKIHSLQLRLAQAQSARLPQVPHRLCLETQQLCANHISRQHIRAGNDYPCLDRVAANRAVS